jgi:hypothetical protein
VKQLRADVAGVDARWLLRDRFGRSGCAYRGGRRVPTDCVIDFVERFARRAFNGDALRSDAAQEHAARF